MTPQLEAAYFRSARSFPRLSAPTFYCKAMIVILFRHILSLFFLFRFHQRFVSDVLPYFGLYTDPAAPDTERLVDSSSQRFNVEFLKNVDADADTEQLRRFLLLKRHTTTSIPILMLTSTSNYFFYQTVAADADVRSVQSISLLDQYISSSVTNISPSFYRYFISFYVYPPPPFTLCVISIYCNSNSVHGISVSIYIIFLCSQHFRFYQHQFSLR